MEMRVSGREDVFKWWLFMATDIIGELSFGESFRMLEAGKVINKQDGALEDWQRQIFAKVDQLRECCSNRLEACDPFQNIIGELSFGESFRMLEAGKVINKQERLQNLSNTTLVYEAIRFPVSTVRLKTGKGRYLPK
jgi:hypothetical protein